MKKFLPYFLAFAIISCANTKQSDPTENENAVKTDTSEYSQDDLEFIKKADSICQNIDAENLFEHVKDGTIVDRDGQEYHSQYKGLLEKSIG